MCSYHACELAGSGWLVEVYTVSSVLRGLGSADWCSRGQREVFLGPWHGALGAAVATVHPTCEGPWVRVLVHMSGLLPTSLSCRTDLACCATATAPFEDMLSC